MAKKLSDIKPNKANPRRIKKDRQDKLAQYLNEYGDLSGVVYNTNPECEALVSGHQRTAEFKRQKAKLTILERYDPAQTDGTTARGFLETPNGQRYTYREVMWDKEKADAATIIANGQFGEWDSDILANAWDFDMPTLLDFGVPDFVVGWDRTEDNAEESGQDGQEYTRKIKAPVYEPKNKKPEILELFSIDKFNELILAIQSSGVTDQEKQFLILSAHRHIVFSFSKIADYYAHSGKEMQALMEQSALVIIDFDKAIEHGFVRLSKQIAQLYNDGLQKEEE